MKTTKNVVAKIAGVIFAGMMVLSLASCGSKNPLAGNSYTRNGHTLTFNADGTGILESDGDEPRSFTYTISGEKTATLEFSDNTPNEKKYIKYENSKAFTVTKGYRLYTNEYVKK